MDENELKIMHPESYGLENQEDLLTITGSL